MNNNLKMIYLILPMVLTACSVAAQSFPGLRFVEPDPVSGYPLLVATPCGDGQSMQTWVTPIKVYSFSDPKNPADLFVDENCLNSAILFYGYGTKGNNTYFIATYTHYKKDGFCEMIPADVFARRTDVAENCKHIGYRIRHVIFDTQAQKMRVALNIFLDRDGYHYGEKRGIGQDNEWTSIATGDWNVIMKNVTKLIDKKVSNLKFRHPELYR